MPRINDDSGFVAVSSGLPVFSTNELFRVQSVFLERAARSLPVIGLDPPNQLVRGQPRIQELSSSFFACCGQAR